MGDCMKKRAFTLVELLGVIAVLGIIIAIVIPKVSNISDKTKMELFELDAKNIVSVAKNHYVSTYGKSLDSSELIEYTVSDGKLFLGTELINNIDGDIIANGEIEIKNTGVENAVISNGKYCYSTYIGVYKITEENPCRKSYPAILHIDLNGGTTEQDQNGIYEDNTQIELESPTMEGYAFYRWEVIEGNSTVEDNKITMAEGETTIRALYKKSGLVLTLDLVTEETTMSDLIESQVIILDDPERRGYIFTGWTCSDPSALSGNILTLKDENITVTANWEIIVYTITYALNDGTIDNPNPSTYTVETETITLNNPRKTGHLFLGWYESPEFVGEPVTQIEKGSIGDRFYYASWKLDKLKFKYTGKFDINGTTYNANSTYATNWYTITDPKNYKIKFLSSGTLTFNQDRIIQAFLVGGGGRDDSGYKSIPECYEDCGGGGGYHKEFSYNIAGDVNYSIVVGAVSSASSAFSQTAAAGRNGQGGPSHYSCGCTVNRIGGTACGEFETSGSTYSGLSGSGANTGKPNQTGIVIIRGISYEGTAIGYYTGTFRVKDNAKDVKVLDNDIKISSSNWRVSFVSSGTLTLYDNINIDAFLVGGGGSSTDGYNSIPECWYDCRGGGGYHTVIHRSLTKNTEYVITVGGVGGGTSAFGSSVSAGSAGYIASHYTCGCTVTNQGGSACNEFETSGSTYSGSGDPVPSTGRRDSTGVVVIRQSS